MNSPPIRDHLLRPGRRCVFTISVSWWKWSRPFQIHFAVSSVLWRYAGASMLAEEDGSELWSSPFAVEDLWASGNLLTPPPCHGEEISG